MIRITKAKFCFSIKDFTVSYPDSDIPEIAIAGKSNVGKSSLINYLTSNSKLAYVSKQPGKTRLVNYFLLNASFYLVDLPGYGYAKVSKKEKISWAEMMNGYFSASPNIKLLVILLDIRHDPSDDDIRKYLRGEELQHDVPNGYGVILYNGAPAGGYKAMCLKLRISYC